MTELKPDWENYRPEDLPKFLARAIKRSVSVTPADLLEAAEYWPDVPPADLAKEVQRKRFDLSYRADIAERVRRERAELGLPEKTIIRIPPRRDD